MPRLQNHEGTALLEREKTPRKLAAARQTWKSQLQYSNLPKG